MISQQQTDTRVNQALLELATALAGSDDSLDTIARLVLDKARDLTDSLHGFVSSVDPDTGDNLVHACSTTEADPSQPEGHTILRSDGKVGSCEVFRGADCGTSHGSYTNLPPTSPPTAEGSEAPVLASRFLTVPVGTEDHLLGRIVLWNPPHDYSDRDLDGVERIAKLYCLALQKQRAQEQFLKNHHRLEELVMERTSELMKVNQSLKAEVFERRRAEQTLRDFSARLLKAQEEERSWLARELHDDLSQKLALLAVELEQLGQKPSQSSTEIRQKTSELWRQTQQISSDLHNLSRQLHPSQFKLLGLVPTLRRFCSEFGKQQRLVVTFSFSQEKIAHSVPEDVALCLYRIAQEALRNVATHSRAQEAQVALSTSHDAVRLCVSDKGVGFDREVLAEKPGLGLVSMRERVRLVGGEITVGSKPSEGTRITVTVPLSHSGSQEEPTSIPRETEGNHDKGGVA